MAGLELTEVRKMWFDHQVQNMASFPKIIDYSGLDTAVTIPFYSVVSSNGEVQPYLEIYHTMYTLDRQNNRSPRIASHYLGQFYNIRLHLNTTRQTLSRDINCFRE